MSEQLDKEGARRWLLGQKEAARMIERERVRRLRTITREESLRIYLELKEASPDDPNRTEVSPVLWAMRKLMRKYAEKMGDRSEPD